MSSYNIYRPSGRMPVKRIEFTPDPTMLWPTPTITVLRREPRQWPQCQTACADCGVGTITLGEWYMVDDHVWEQAWQDRRKWWHALPGQEILCIGCLERRLGRTLTGEDFTDAPINDPNQKRCSERMRARLMATETQLMATETRRRRGRLKGSKNKPEAELGGSR